jgi:hypothetical protein
MILGAAGPILLWQRRPEGLDAAPGGWLPWLWP